MSPDEYIIVDRAHSCVRQACLYEVETMLSKLCMCKLCKGRVHQQMHEQYKLVFAAQASCWLHKMHMPAQMVFSSAEALLNPETSVFIQERHPYTGNLNSETSGDSINAFLHCGDVLGLRDL